LTGSREQLFRFIANHIRCAVQVPEHIAPRQVPDPDVAVRRPEPTARFIPLVSAR
jgi:hypothetical protein